MSTHQLAAMLENWSAYYAHFSPMIVREKVAELLQIIDEVEHGSRNQ